MVAGIAQPDVAGRVHADRARAEEVVRGHFALAERGLELAVFVFG
jgi:hypothetical protein